MIYAIFDVTYFGPALRERRQRSISDKSRARRLGRDGFRLDLFGGGVIYTINGHNDLMWYRHVGIGDGSEL